MDGKEQGVKLLIVDSREQWTQERSTDTHIPNWLNRHGINWEVRKLEVGDYMLEGGVVSIDRKANLDEISRNLMNRSDRSRFWKEVRRAREQHMRLIVLCEHGKGIETIRDVANWKSAYSPVSGKALMNEIYRVNISYGVDFLFCNRRQTAKRIWELLTEEPDGNENLLRGD